MRPVCVGGVITAGKEPICQRTDYGRDKIKNPPTHCQPLAGGGIFICHLAGRPKKCDLG